MTVGNSEFRVFLTAPQNEVQCCLMKFSMMMEILYIRLFIFKFNSVKLKFSYSIVLTTLQVPNSHMWLVAIVLDRVQL